MSDLFVSPRFPPLFPPLQIINPVLFVASTGGFQRVSRISVLKIHGDAAAHPAAEHKQASKRPPLIVSTYHKHHPLSIVAHVNDRTLLLSLLSPPDCIRSVPSISEAHTQLDGGS